MENFHPDCIFCRLCAHEQYPEALHTTLVHEDEKLIAVIDDHTRQYRIRYLLVTKYGHCSQEELPQEEWDYLIEAAHALGKARVWNSQEKYVIDDIMTDPSHAHLQVCFYG